MILNPLEIMDQHIVIRETVGYEGIKDIEVYDLPQVIDFLQIVYNYNKMQNILKESNQN